TKKHRGEYRGPRSSPRSGPSSSPALSRPSVLTNPTWARQILPEYSERAARGVTEVATVLISRALQPNGSLTDCLVVSEDRTGMGFGSAALAAARRSRVTPGTVDGAAVTARVEYNIRFRPPPPEQSGMGPGAAVPGPFCHQVSYGPSERHRN
ncbi:MAG: energy transducer TonB, partial [Pseudomonadota bacterium]|nr:energy transducer TonB [Pseudomonadota bacterium]